MNEFLKKCLVLFALCFVCSIVIGEDPEATGDVRCYKNSCEKIECPNVTCINGTLFNSPSYECGCCKQCILQLSKDQTCGPELSDRECGPGLTCAPKDGKYFCMKKNTTCVQAQYEFDGRKQKGEVGMYEARPECDREGEYVAKKCTPGGSCYCIDKEGKRIFGEGLPDAVLAGETMDCQCSRDYEVAKQLRALDTAAFFHCLPNGNYDKLQCIAQACFCINPTDQSLASVNKEPITNVEDLPCFKEEIHVNKYYRPCEVERNQARQLRFQYSRNNVTVITIDLPICTPDGYYHPLRKSESRMYCANPHGEKIEDFEVGEDSASAKTMNCNCARSRYWLDSSKVSKPTCCKNGNFRPIQCRGGVCFCVNSNGDQVGLEVPSANYASLNCHDPATFPTCDG